MFDALWFALLGSLPFSIWLWGLSFYTIIGPTQPSIVVTALSVTTSMSKIIFLSPLCGRNELTFYGETKWNWMDFVQCEHTRFARVCVCVSVCEKSLKIEMNPQLPIVKISKVLHWNSLGLLTFKENCSLTQKDRHFLSCSSSDKIYISINDACIYVLFEC